MAGGSLFFFFSFANIFVIKDCGELSLIPKKKLPLDLIFNWELSENYLLFLGHVDCFSVVWRYFPWYKSGEH